MIDMEKAIKGLEGIIDYFFDIYRNDTDSYKCEKAQGYFNVAIDAIVMLKARDELLHKKQKDIDKLCNEISEWKHKYYDTLKEQEAMHVIQDRMCEVEPNVWERKGFCPKCHQIVLWSVNRLFCGFCGQELKWNG